MRALTAAIILCGLGAAACGASKAAPEPAATHDGVRYSAVGDDPRILLGHQEMAIMPYGQYVLRYDPDAACLYVVETGRAENGGDRLSVPVWAGLGTSIRPLVKNGRRGVAAGDHTILEGDTFGGAPQGSPAGLGESLRSAGLPSSCGKITELSVIAQPGSPHPS
ncbi:hypothetical protein ABGB12_01325 [Actinocorallia sp. B10E7]|uniref:hypothetical protein n=1 Tax=Actinocorallia sp. B10E7 TaxID=3153558 RepID=UPI00325E9ECD